MKKDFRRIEDIICANQAAGGHFFDKSTMRFFASRKMSGIVIIENADRILFFTSEKKCFDDYTRVYSVNVFVPGSGEIETWRKSTFSSAYRARSFAKICQRTGVIPEHAGDLD